MVWRARGGTHTLERSVAVWRRALSVVDRDTEADGLDPRWGRIILWLPLTGTVGLVGVYLVHRPWLYWLLREDHLVEWLQFAVCLFAVPVAIVAATRLARRGYVGFAVLMAVTAFGCLVLAGEEISWAQRVFGVTEPEALAGANRQGELNLHNLSSGGVSLHDLTQLAELVMSLAAVGLSLLARPVRARWAATGWWYVAPPLCTMLGFLVTALYRGYSLAAPDMPSPLIVYQEWAELCFYLAIVVTVSWCYVRTGADRHELATGRRRRIPAQVAPRSSSRDWTILLGVALAVTLVTVVFAVLTSRTGMMPGNVPGVRVPGSSS